MADDEAAGRRPEAEAEAYWDRALQAHILEKHKLQIQEVALVEEDYVWDVYQEALAVQERRTVPAVGAAIDRRAFEATLERYNDDKICALICFSCARICLNTGCSRSDIEYVAGSWLLHRPAGPKRAKSRGKRRVMKNIINCRVQKRSTP